MELTMPRPGMVFANHERPVCSKCGKSSHFGLRGHFIVCDGSTGASRCGTWHYVMQDQYGNAVFLRVTRDEARQVHESDLPTAVLSSLGLPQIAQEMLMGVKQAA